MGTTMSSLLRQLDDARAQLEVARLVGDVKAEKSAEIAVRELGSCINERTEIAAEQYESEASARKEIEDARN